jgi:DNA (cytosine-5)-methyltransferase 1
VNVDSPAFNIVSVCAGIGGLDRGLKRAVGNSRVVAYVEREAHACAILEARMQDGSMDVAPIWNDLATFDGRPFRGVVDGIIGGYPCQPFSVAGARRGADDPRHLWPHIARILGEIGPTWAFFENVAGHLSLGFAEVAENLSGLGYRIAAGIFSAEEVGAPHRRERLFILAHGEGVDGKRAESKRIGRGEPETSNRNGSREFPPGPGDIDAWRDILARNPELAPAVKPVVRGMADGPSHRIDRLRALGNAVVPACAAKAFATLYGELRGMTKVAGMILALLVAAPGLAGVVIEPRAIYTNRSPLPEIIVTKDRAEGLVAEHIELSNRRIEVVALRVAVAAASNVQTNRATAWSLEKRYLDTSLKRANQRAAASQIVLAVVVSAVLVGAIKILVESSMK